MAAPPSSVRLHYIKSNAFRVVHVDGVIGGPTPGGFIHASFFSERIPLPTMVEHELKPTSEAGVSVFGKETHREGKSGLVREVEVGVMLTLEMAKKLRTWLDENIGRLESNAIDGDADAS